MPEGEIRLENMLQINWRQSTEDKATHENNPRLTLMQEKDMLKYGILISRLVQFHNITVDFIVLKCSFL